MMNESAENAFLALPVAIGEFESKIRRSYFDWDPDEIKWEHVNHTNQRLFQKNLFDLLAYYHNDKQFLTKEQVETLQEQLRGEDREAWYLAFVLIDNLKHKLWTNEEKKDNIT